jgi:EmrB/QacA subfamily drug resistance transporter
MLAVGTGSFMSALDSSAVNAVLPVVGRSFGASVAAIEWVVLTYLLAVSGLLLSLGRLGDLRGHKAVYLTGFLVFVASSLLCSLAFSVPALVAFRAAQGVGAAMLFANSSAIITKTFPGRQRGRALGLLAMMVYLGLTAGPSLGGWLTETLGWRAIFYVNVPTGLLAVALSVAFIPADAARTAHDRFDFGGAALFLAGFVTLLLALNQGHAWGWNSPAIVGLLALAGATLATFVWVERRVPAPMLDLTLFRARAFSAAVLSAVCNYVCVFSIAFLMPFYLIHGRGLSASRAGTLLVAQPLVMALVAPLSGALSDRIGSRGPAAVGMTTLGAGILLMSRLGPEEPLVDVVRALVVTGLGTGTFISPNSSALMGSAPGHRQGIAAGVLGTARSVGMVLGIGLAGAVFTTVLARAEAHASTTAVFDGIRAGFLAASLVAALGVVAALARGGRAPSQAQA